MQLLCAILVWFETALDYKPQILDPKIEEFPCLVHKLSVISTALDYKPHILGHRIEEFPCLVHELSVILTALQYKPHWKMG